MARQRKEPMLPMTRATLERLATIMGRNSAAAAALRDMDAYQGEAEAFVSGSTIFVVKHPREA